MQQPDSPFRSEKMRNYGTFMYLQDSRTLKKSIAGILYTNDVQDYNSNIFLFYTSTALTTGTSTIGSVVI